MAQWFRAPATLPEALASNPSTHTAVTQAPWCLEHSLASTNAAHMYIDIHAGKAHVKSHAMASLHSGNYHRDLEKRVMVDRDRRL